MIIFYIILFAYGAVIGSFVNVLIYRLPEHQDVVRVRSHCTSCGYQLRWFDLIPIVSWVIYGGRCRKCGSRISVQYPFIEALNGVLYILAGVKYSFSIRCLLVCLTMSALVAIAVIDLRTFIIPPSLNLFIGIMGVIGIITDPQGMIKYLAGLFSVSLLLLLIYLISRGRAIGGGDIKLMAASGLLLGWQLNILAFFIGCILGSIIHPLRMKLTGAGKVLALGPYLAAGIIISLLWGDEMIAAYLRLYI
ncbi:prepilin peptidase [Butyrivibrio sp. MC2013]|uniref:prepilin peptidase n=1 Tax=Butyrivibrio sp. MC2013 TaxID=1280686 RepID=UPI000407F508|nr:A24 family peptidase [Butyrivibrio sp. MC2013]